MGRRTPNDPDRVSINDEREAGYRCREFGCSVDDLREAVGAVGVQADDVRQHPAGPTRDPSRAVDAVRG